MNETLYTIRMCHGNGGTQKDLLTDFGFVCLEGASYPKTDKFKELDKTSWYDEDGVDVYRPSRRYKESFNIEIPIGCEGNRAAGGMSVRQRYDTLEQYLTTGIKPDGMRIEMPMEQCGYYGCDLVEINDKEYQKRGDYEIFTCKLVFSVSNPNDYFPL